MAKRKRADLEADLAILGETVEKLAEEVQRLRQRIATIEAKPDPFRPIGPRVVPWIEPTTQPRPPWENPNTGRPIITYDIRRTNSSDPEQVAFEILARLEQ